MERMSLSWRRESEGDFRYCHGGWVCTFCGLFDARIHFASARER